MRTGKRLAAEFANAGGALLAECFPEKDLQAIEDCGEQLFLILETSGRTFRGVYCIHKKASGQEERLFSLTAPDKERTKTESQGEAEESAQKTITAAE